MHKLSLSLIFVVFLATMGLGWAIDRYFESYGGEEEQDIVTVYKKVGLSLANSVNKLDQPQGFIKAWNQFESNQIALISADEFPLPPELENGFRNGEPLVLQSQDKVSLHYYLNKNNLVLTFTPDELAQSHALPKVNLILTSLFYFGLFAFLLLWLIPLSSRLTLLRRTAKEFGAGQLSKRIGTNKTSYIADIELEFNRMASRIESLIADNKLISSAVSHDLRTPLARIRLGVDVLSETSNKAEIEKYQKRLDCDLDEMQSLIESLLAYAKLEPAFIKIEKKKIDLAKHAADCCNSTMGDLRECSVMGADKPAIILADPTYLNMAIKNVLANAYRHSVHKVAVELGGDKNVAWLQIHDDGSGIEESNRQNVMKPFIKFGSSGHGMGLAIAERIAGWHHASIAIDQSPLLGGALIKLVFPREAPNG